MKPINFLSQKSMQELLKVVKTDNTKIAKQLELLKTHVVDNKFDQKQVDNEIASFIVNFVPELMKGVYSCNYNLDRFDFRYNVQRLLAHYARSVMGLGACEPAAEFYGVRDMFSGKFTILRKLQVSITKTMEVLFSISGVDDRYILMNNVESIGKKANDVVYGSTFKASFSPIEKLKSVNCYNVHEVVKFVNQINAMNASSFEEPSTPFNTIMQNVFSGVGTIFNTSSVSSRKAQLSDFFILVGIEIENNELICQVIDIKRSLLSGKTVTTKRNMCEMVTNQYISCGDVPDSLVALIAQYITVTEYFKAN